jgi:preprotein translocase subunit SecE
MANETKLANKVDKRVTKKKEKRPNIFARFIHFCKDVVSELKRVSWPTRKELLTYTGAVIVFILISSALIALLDLVFSEGMSLLVK